MRNKMKRWIIAYEDEEKYQTKSRQSAERRGNRETQTSRGEDYKRERENKEGAFSESSGKRGMADLRNHPVAPCTKGERAR